MSTSNDHEQGRHPLAVFLAEPDSHLADLLYINFRIYKREVIWGMFEKVAKAAVFPRDGVLNLADIGASMGFDMKYVLNRLTGGFVRRGPWSAIHVTLLEGDEQLIADGEREWVSVEGKAGIAHRYVRADLAGALPLPDASQHLALCSEVVEHLVNPGALLREACRILRPGGCLILTTDNSPSMLQRIRRIPVWLSGRHRRAYARPDRNDEITGHVVFNGEPRPIYGHINLNPTRHWEKLASRAGFEVVSFGTYESVRRGGARRSPGVLAAYFAVGYIVSLLPVRLGRFWGDTTALLLQKPNLESRKK
jgi:SAM-dependent methyltransferase